MTISSDHNTFNKSPRQNEVAAANPVQLTQILEEIQGLSEEKVAARRDHGEIRWFSTALAIVPAILFLLSTTTELFRQLFDITVLQQPLDYEFIASLVLIWALLLQLT